MDIWEPNGGLTRQRVQATLDFLIQAGGVPAGITAGQVADLSYLDAPPRFTVLYCLETPEAGGDTVWANQYMAFDTLSSGMRDTLMGLNAVHSAGPAYGTGGYLDDLRSSRVAARPVAAHGGRG